MVMFDKLIIQKQKKIKIKPGIKILNHNIDTILDLGEGHRPQLIFRPNQFI